MKLLFWLALLSSLSWSALAESSSPGEKAIAFEAPASLMIREIRYDGQLTDDEARFFVDIEAEATGKGESSVKLFEGEVALLPPKLSDQLKVVRDGNRYFLTAKHPGKFKFKLELVAKIQRAEPWNPIPFTGPIAAIASVNAQADGARMEVQKLEAQLRNVQARNLIQAQQEFSLNNASVPGIQVQQTLTGQNPVQYDDAAAEAQWTKLAQAQEVAAAKVQPLHVNLPLRGLRHAFTQVLQTEPNNVPMTIQLSAVNSKTGTWLKRVGMGLVGFLVLWGLVAVMAARKHE